MTTHKKLRVWLFVLSLFASAGVLAQSVSGVTERAANELIQAGVLGTITVVLLCAVAYLQTRLDKLQEKHRAEIIELAKAQSALLSEHGLLQKQQNELLAKMNDKLDRVRGV